MKADDRLPMHGCESVVGLLKLVEPSHPAPAHPDEETSSRTTG